MENLEKYKKVFITNLGVSDNELSNLTYQSVANWDSVGHMGLIAALEEEFDIVMEMDDIIELSSFNKGKEILKKYNVEL